MAFVNRTCEKRKLLHEMHAFSMDDSSEESSSNSPRNHLEQEKRMRREIANSNERRRMQSINTGFQSLRALIASQDGEKLSKAAILLQTTRYITNLEREKNKLASQNSQLKKMLADLGRGDGERRVPGAASPKRKKADTESSDEGISLGFEDQSVDELKRELVDLRSQLDRERRLRLIAEERTQSLEARLSVNSYPELTGQPQVAFLPKRERKVKYYSESTQFVQDPEVKEEPQSSPVIVQPAETSMSRRNLETIVQAIRHLEGESILVDRPELRKIPQSEESEKECSTGASDLEDSKSDCSGRESPISFSKHTIEGQIKSHEKYPIAMKLLHRPLPEQFRHRPAVIIQTSS